MNKKYILLIAICFNFTITPFFFNIPKFIAQILLRKPAETIGVESLKWITGTVLLTTLDHRYLHGYTWKQINNAVTVINRSAYVNDGFMELETYFKNTFKNFIPACHALLEDFQKESLKN
jgi:hypothetical protein